MDGPSLSVRVRPSILQCYLLRALHAAAALAVLVCGLPPWVKAVLLLVVLFSVQREYRKLRLAMHDEPIVVRCIGNEWSIAHGGDSQLFELLPDSRVLPYAVVLRFRRAGRRFAETLLLWRDSAHSDELRRLRVCLRLHVGLAQKVRPWWRWPGL
jgi:toxin CptA